MSGGGRFAPDASIAQFVYVLRAMRWGFIVLGAGLGVALVLVSHVVDVGPFASVHAGIGLAVIALAVGASFVLDDPAASTLEPLPATLRWRITLRLAAASVFVAAALGMVFLAAWERLAYADALGQAAGLLVVGVAAAAAAGRIAGWDRPGIVGAAMVIAFILADGLSLLPADDPLLTGGAGRPAPAVVTDITWLALLAVLAAAYVWGTRDPAGRRRG